eukprot:TRINITY_DN106209_c0_g1_i1.p1 TRINITY_DN106209_c0_g1~~TRINITY_DN106209_c0_g1_i1.p1  ORF type:complete len:616 (+),score=149.55 TRINITY_DN106209_c0_g1_i1:105-1952(+)
MFDMDNLNTFLSDRLRPHEEARTTPASASQVPKSREERLRDFYASRQSTTTTVERLPKDSGYLQRRSEPDEAAQEQSLGLRKEGNDLFEACDYEGAVEKYTAAIKTAPSSVLHSNRAASYMMLGWWDQALRDTKIALRKDPENLKALERQGRALLALDQLDNALQVTADLEARGPKEEFQGTTRPAQGIRRLRWLAQAARNPSTLEECRAVVEQFGSKAEMVSPLGVRLQKKLIQVLVERSDAVDNQRKIRPALAYNKLTEADGDEIQELTPFAEEAVRISSELLQDYPEDADLRYWHGRALVRLGRHADAEAQLQQGLKEDSNHEQINSLMDTIESLENIKQRANAFYKDGKLDEAISLYSAGIERDPDCEDTRTVATLHYNRAAALRKKGEFEKALEDANLCLALHPKWTKALYRRGILLLECGRFAEALTELKVVQRADPTFDDDLQEWLRRAHHWLSKPRHERNFYKFMSLPMDASKEDIRRQYRRLCLLWHPDKRNSSEDDRARFEELQEGYRFLMDEEQREEYDFGIWKDRPVRHHVKKRDKVKESWDDNKTQEEEEGPRSHFNWGDKHLIEDEKVESIYWGEEGCPAWLKEKRRAYQMKRFGKDWVTQ